jgi:5-methylcytosine-specific restriction endonuclease McrA
MTVSEATRQVLELIEADISASSLDIDLDPNPSSTDDPGKFLLEGELARVVQPFNGFHANINLDWFEGSDERPEIQREPFYWYVFALRGQSGEEVETYHVCDFLSLKSYVLDFEAPEGDDHRDHHDWRGEIQELGPDTGYFRWGDEPTDEQRLGRQVQLRNIEVATGDVSPTTSGHRTPSDNEESAHERASDTGEIQDENRRRKVTTSRVVRDTSLARDVKEHHNHECQLCGNTLHLSGDERYAEAHHVKPLGSPHDGPDVIKNILCLCPNCHVRLDYGTRELSRSDLRETDRHRIDDKYIQHHNQKIVEEGAE